jgi:iron complex outermembrane receptor protein
MKPRFSEMRLSAMLTMALLVSLPAGAQPAQSTSSGLAGASLEDLMNMRVTSVSRKEESLSKAGAAVFVISEEDIRRSGASNIPDLLRMVPGVNVAQINANSWAISIRGFNDRYTDKVLVMVDGRSVYSDVNTGVNWDEVDVPLEDIARIEVIRGPGGTIWGANAVNGVINIRTKSSNITHGGLIVGSSGTRAGAGGLVQYGGAAGPNGSYRIFEKYFNIEDSPSEAGRTAADGWHAFHEGFRTDWQLSPADSLTVQGGLLRTGEGQHLTNVVMHNALPLVQSFDDRIRDTSGNILGRWKHVLPNGSDFSLQVYNSYSSKIAQGLRITENTTDLDFQHHITPGPRHDLVWGFGYRSIGNRSEAGYNVNFLPAYRRDHLASAFFQDEIHLSNSVSLTVGTKLEHNSFTGFEFEPGAQAVWSTSPRHSVWASASRAIRQPARRDYGIDVDLAAVPMGNNQFAILELIGNQTTESETLRHFETGYRTLVGSQLSIDVTGFLDLYRRLETTSPGQPFLNTQSEEPYFELPLVVGYGAHARNYGAEIFAHWNVSPRWRLSPGFSWLNMRLKEDPAMGMETVIPPENTPTHSFQIHSAFDLTPRLEWDVTLSGVSAIYAVPGYPRLDTRLGWRTGEHLELSIVGQHLLSPARLEFPDQYFVESAPVARSVSLKAVLRF